MPPIHQKVPAQLDIDALNPSKGPARLDLNQFQHPGILAPTQSNHSENQPSWHPLNQTILRMSVQCIIKMKTRIWKVSSEENIMINQFFLNLCTV